MNRKNYVSLKTAINDINVKSGNKIELDPDDILYLANGIAELIIPGDSFVEGIALIDIENYKGKLPSNLKYISQALYLEDTSDPHMQEQVVQWVKNVYGTGCEIKLDLQCDPCNNSCNTQLATLDVDYNYLLKNPEWAYNHSKFFYGQRKLENYNNSDCRVDEPKFQLMRRTTNNFFNIPYHINECINFNNDSHIEYNIEYPYLVTNMKKGYVIIAYLGVAIDNEGYRMIPAIEEVYEAIYYSIVERLLEQKTLFDNDISSRLTRTNYKDIEMKAARKRKSATQKLSTLEPDEWEMFLRNHWVRTVPYYKWERFGNKYIGDKAYTKNHTIGNF